MRPRFSQLVRGSGGMTLLETLMVIGLIGVLIAAFTGSFQSIADSTAERNTVARLAAARSAALGVYRREGGWPAEEELIAELERRAPNEQFSAAADPGAEEIYVDLDGSELTLCSRAASDGPFYCLRRQEGRGLVLPDSAPVAYAREVHSRSLKVSGSHDFGATVALLPTGSGEGSPSMLAELGWEEADVDGGVALPATVRAPQLGWDDDPAVSPGQLTASTNAAFSWTVETADGRTPEDVRCLLDGEEIACDEGLDGSGSSALSGLTAGSHSFRLEAHNSAGRSSLSWLWAVS